MLSTLELKIFKELFLEKKYSVFSLWSDKDLFQKIINELAEPFLDMRIDKVIGIESRGYILAAPIAYILKAGFVPARNGGRLIKSGYSKDEIIEESFVDYTKQKKSLEIEKNDRTLNKGERVLIIDDWFETGSQGQATIRLVEKIEAKVVGIGIMFDDMNPEVKDSFAKHNLHSLVRIKEFERTN